jgi:hypothetical protein
MFRRYVLRKDSPIREAARRPYLMARSSYRKRVLHRKAILPRLDIQVTDHCNLACSGCNHFSPLSPPVFASPEVVERDITRLAELFDNVGWLLILGGEPLLHPRLVEFARLARRAFPTAGIALITNGLLLMKMPDQLWEELVSLGVQFRVSVYPVPLDIDTISEIANRHRADIILNRINSFRKLPIRQGADCNPARAFRKCGMCPLLRDGRLYPCAYTGLSSILEHRFGVAPPVERTDYIDIHDEVDGYQIVKFLSHPVDWCRHCDNDAVETYPWRPSRRVLEEWT